MVDKGRFGAYNSVERRLMNASMDLLGVDSCGCTH